MLDFPSLLYKGLRILMFQLSGVYCMLLRTTTFFQEFRLGIKLSIDQPAGRTVAGAAGLSLKFRPFGFGLWWF